MKRAWSCLAGLLWLLLTAVPLQAAGPFPTLVSTPAAATAAPDPAADAQLTRAQAHRLLEVLSDPARRAALIDNLQAMEKAVPVLPTPAASALPLAPDSLLKNVATQAGTWAAVLGDQLTSLQHLASGLPGAWRWASQAAGDSEVEHAAGTIAWQLGLILAAAWLMERGTRLLLRTVVQWIATLGPHDEASAPQGQAGSKAEARPHAFARVIAALRKGLLAFCHLVVLLIPVAVFAAVGNLLLGTALVSSARARLVILTAINAYLLLRVLLCVARVIVTPDRPTWRLVRMSDGAARASMRWVRWVGAVLVFGMAAIELAVLLGLGAASALALQKLVLLIVHICLVLIVLQARAGVAARIRPPSRVVAAGRHRPLVRLAIGFAGVWHIFAIFLILALWLVWAADLQGGYAGLLRFILVTIVVLVGARGLTGLLYSLIDHWTHHFGDPATTRDARGRIAHYLGAVRALVRGAVGLVAVLVLLELWGADVFGWISGNQLGRQMLGATVTIVVTLVLGVVAWESVNLAMDSHLVTLVRDAQIARIARLRTLLPILRTALLATILLIVGLTALSELGVNIGPLLAGAGILGVAIGFGSQKLVQDFITGIFLLLENAMQVGDFVTLAGVSGSVENLSIRTIRLRAGDGSVHIIPFSSVTMVNNTNRGLGNAAISVLVSSREDTDAVGAAMKQIVLEMRADGAFGASILSDLQLWGVDRIDGATVTLVGQVVCTDAGRWGVQREFNRRAKKRFEELGITLGLDTRAVRVEQVVPPSVTPAPVQADGDPGGDPGETTATVRDSPPPSSLGHTE